MALAEERWRIVWDKLSHDRLSYLACTLGMGVPHAPAFHPATRAVRCQIERFVIAKHSASRRDFRFAVRRARVRITEQSRDFECQNDLGVFSLYCLVSRALGGVCVQLAGGAAPGAENTSESTTPSTCSAL